MRQGESEHLLAHVKLSTSESAKQKSSCVCSPGKYRYLCVPSKAAILIIVWTAIVGMMFQTVMALSAGAVSGSPQPQSILVTYAPVPYAILAFIMIFYPLSGFIADVCCGRLRTVAVSLILLLIHNALTLLSMVVLQTMIFTPLFSSRGWWY